MAPDTEGPSDEVEGEVIDPDEAERESERLASEEA